MARRGQKRDPAPGRPGAGRAGLALALLAAATGAARAQASGDSASQAQGFLLGRGFDATAGIGAAAPATTLPALESLGLPPAGGQSSALAARGWDLRPSLGITLTGTDNALNSSVNRRSDLITVVQPSLLATAATPRIVGSFSYAPQIRFYANSSGQDRIDHFFNGSARAAVLEDRVFLDLRAFGTVQATGGGFTPQNSVVVDRRNQVQTTSYQVAPYAVHRFGSLAAAQVGYAFRHTQSEGSAAFLPGTARPYFTPQQAQGHEGFAVIRSGEDLGRLGLELRLVGTSFEGTGVFDGAHRAYGTLQASYALNRLVTGLIEGGYEDQRYAGITPFTVQDAIWSVGVRLTPNADSALTARFGRHDGRNSASLDANLAIGARTTLTALYNEGLGTAVRQAADLLTNPFLDPFGTSTARSPGFPTVVPFAGSVLGPLGGPLEPGLSGYAVPPIGGSTLAYQNSLFRTRQGNAVLTHRRLRDTVSLNVSYQERTPLATPVGSVAFAQAFYATGLTWSRLLTEDTQLALSGQYGRSTSRTAGDTDSYHARAILSRSFTPGLAGSLQYGFTYRTGAVQPGLTASSRSATQNLVIATLRQTF